MFTDRKNHTGRRRRLLLLLATLLLAVALAACEGLGGDTTDLAAATPDEAAVVDEPLLDPTVTPIPSVTVLAQEIMEGAVTVPLVTAVEPGWIVIHADDNGAPGPVIGQAPVAVGANTDVSVQIDEAAATETLYAMLHVDAGTAGTYEFPGDDGPVTVDGEVVVEPFAVSGLEAGMGMDEVLTPSVAVEDQDLSDSMVTVPEVVAAEPGWIVIHADEGGAPGPVIGQAPVAVGANTDVSVQIDEAAATETLYAMLHVDAGTAGTYEFPGDDGPVTVDGEVVVQPFAVTMAVSGSLNAVGLELVAEGLTSPLVFKPFPDGSGRYAIADQIGVVRVLESDGALSQEPFLNLSDRMVDLGDGYSERGLLGFAFHPDYADNGRFFVYYSAPLRASAPADWDHTSHIAEFQVSDDANAADPAAEQVLLQVDQPQGNHNAGEIVFGPDGYLYIPLGDGGAADDVAIGHATDWYDFNEGGNGQDRTENMLGSILRIDVDSEGADGQPYAIPADNPFIDVDGVAPEQWAYGFRNPFRVSFDMGGDNALFVSDAGQNRWEEVSLVESGGNYGWNVKEGTHCFDAANPDQPLDACPDTDDEGDPLIDPIIEYANANQQDGLGLVVIGGHVYRGEALPEMDGTYFFGDWSDDFATANGKIFAATPAEGSGLWSFEQLTISNSESGNLDRYLLSFGQDDSGEIYVLTTANSGPTGDTGRIFRLVAPEMAGPMMEAEATTVPAEEGETADAEQASATAAITIANFAFDSPEVTIAAGTTVTWTNQNGVAHTVTAGTPDAANGDFFDSGRIEPDGTFSFTFDEPGSYDYFCQIHPQMRGTIIVEG